MSWSEIIGHFGTYVFADPDADFKIRILLQDSKLCSPIEGKLCKKLENFLSIPEFAEVARYWVTQKTDVKISVRSIVSLQALKKIIQFYLITSTQKYEHAVQAQCIWKLFWGILKNNNNGLRANHIDVNWLRTLMIETITF
jgi:hypothetical protein